MSCEVPLSFALPAVVAPLIAQDMIVGLATTGPQRLAFLPSVPTLAEAGYPVVDVVSCDGCRRCGSSSRASHRSFPRSASRSSSARRLRRQPDPRAVTGSAAAGGAADAGPWVGLPPDGLQRPTEAGPAPGIRIGDRAG